MADALALLDDTLLAHAAAVWFKTAKPVYNAPGMWLSIWWTPRDKFNSVQRVSGVKSYLNQSSGRCNKPWQRPLSWPLSHGLTRSLRFHFSASWVWLVSDVRSTLYPLLDRWPTPSATAESSIVATSPSMCAAC